MKYIVVIPARYKSKRLPGKPLAKIGGLPMIVRTYNQCKKVVKKDQIIVATDSVKIKKVCDEYKINSLITSSKCLTGTDRVAEVAKKINCSFYINVQGDEPFFNPYDLKKLINIAKKNPNEIINGYAEIKDSSFVIANDTGPAHIAAHLGSKGLALFGSHTTPYKVNIETQNFKAIQASELKKLSADKVLERLNSLL